MGKRRRGSTSSESDGGHGSASNQRGKYGCVYVAFSPLSVFYACMHVYMHALGL